MIAPAPIPAAQRLKVATWSARGMYGGIVVPCRRVANLQQWSVQVAIRKPNTDASDQVDELWLNADKPCSLRAMHATVMHHINDLLIDGDLVRDARITFYIRRRK